MVARWVVVVAAVVVAAVVVVSVVVVAVMAVVVVVAVVVAVVVVVARWASPQPVRNTCCNDSVGRASQHAMQMQRVWRQRQTR